MNEVVAALVQMAKAELEKYEPNGMPVTGREIASEYHRKFLRAWCYGGVLNELRREAFAESGRSGERVPGAPVPDRAFAAHVLTYLRRQSLASARHLTPNVLRINASHAGSERAHGYYLSEGMRRDFLLRMEEAVTPMIDKAHYGLSTLVRLPLEQFPSDKDYSQLVDAAANVRELLVNSRDLRIAVADRRNAVIECYSWVFDEAKSLLESPRIAAAQGERRSVSLIAYGFDKAGVPLRQVYSLQVGGGAGARTERGYDLQGWGDREGEVVLPTGGLSVFEQRMQLPITRPPIVPEMTIEKCGVRLVLQSGQQAAETIRDGGIPFLKFSQSDAMHKALDAMGIFENVASTQTAPGYRRCGPRPVAYVVFDETPNSGKWRDVRIWLPKQHASYAHEVAGWGDQEGDVALPADRDELLAVISSSRQVRYSALAFGGDVARVHGDDSELVKGVRMGVHDHFTRRGHWPLFEVGRLVVDIRPSSGEDAYLHVEMSAQLRSPCNVDVLARGEAREVLQDQLEHVLHQMGTRLYRLQYLGSEPMMQHHLEPAQAEENKALPEDVAPAPGF